MGILSKFFKPRPVVQPLPHGSITVNRDGEILTSTVSSTYPRASLSEIAKESLRLLREAREAQLAFAELSLHFASLRITAREMQGGAIIFLSPQNALAKNTGKKP